nr:L2 [Equus caballus papillomavirus 10]
MGQDCPPDIKAKFENDTLADRFLKWVSSFLYLGNLGFSTGRGNPRFGYRPVGGGVGEAGGGVRVGTPITDVSPGVTVETVGPAEVVPVDSLSPSAPAVVPAGEGTGGAVDVELVAEVHPTVDPGMAGGSGGVTSNGGDAAVLEVPPEVVPRGRNATSRTQFHNPAFHVELNSSLPTGESSASDHVFVQAEQGGHWVGEEIELLPLGDTLTQRTSTPRTGARGRAESGAERLFGRGFRQVRVTDPNFLSDPGSLVQFGFENPAYDPSGSISFGPLGEPEAAPNPEFQDVVHLGRTHITERDGRVVLGRFGQRAGVSTRSGRVVGPQVHYRFEFSSIAPAEEIELVPLPSADPPGSLGDEFEVIDLDSTGSVYSEAALLDDDSLSIHGVLSLGQRAGSHRAVSVLDFAGPRAFYSALTVEGDVAPAHPNPTSSILVVPENAEQTPSVVVESMPVSGLYDLHPSLHPRRRRKRRRSFCFADGSVDTKQAEAFSASAACY